MDVIRDKERNFVAGIIRQWASEMWKGVTLSESTLLTELIGPDPDGHDLGDLVIFLNERFEFKEGINAEHWQDWRSVADVIDYIVLRATSEDPEIELVSCDTAAETA